MSSELPPEPSQEDPAYKVALERAEMLQGYYVHVLVYVVVNVGLFFINLFTKGDGGGWWFYWVTIGWGIGLLVHTMVTFFGVFSEGWKDRKAADIYRRGHHTPSAG